MSESKKKLIAEQLIEVAGLDVSDLRARFQEYGANSQGRPEAIGEILGSWLVNGRRGFVVRGQALPWEPALHYRMTGEWTSWGDFFGVESDMENRLQDGLENEAWRVWLAMWKTVLAPDD